MQSVALKNKSLLLESDRLLMFPLSIREMKWYVEPGNQLESELGLQPGERTITPELTDALTHSIMPALEEPGRQIEFLTLWTIILKNGNVMVGDCCFKGEPGFRKEVEIGYGTYPAFQGKGYMSEAIQMLSDWALSQSGIEMVLAETLQENLASQRILQKAGFVMYKEERGMRFWKKTRHP